MNFGRRVQKSVFECYLNEKQLGIMKNRLETKIDFERDQIRYYFLCRQDMNKVETEGKNVTYKDEDYFVI